MDEPTETRDSSLHTAATSPLLRDLWVRAHGPDLPSEVDPSSSCSWWTLGYAVSRLRLAPDDLLIDLGCGRAGPSLWLARALRARLIGIDLSEPGIALAAQRASAFVPEGRAEFRQASFEETGLPDATADGLFSVDALPFSEDVPAALREAFRILRPGGRLVFSAWETDLPDDTGVPSWPAALTAAGFAVEDRSPHPGCTERWLALYALLLDHEAELREQVNGEAVDRLIAEAVDRPRRMPYRRNLLLTAHRPT
ncbi:MAG: class I SAM-dependent methyltransferase [Umezawaea sp.]